MMKLISVFLSLIITSSIARANVLGDFQTFIPNTDGMFFITVDSAQTLKKGTFIGNAYLSYAKDYLLVNDDYTNQNRINYKDSFLSLDGTVTYSVKDDLQAFVGITNLLDQKSEAGQAQDHYVTTGVHTYRPGLKWKFKSNHDSQMALVGSVDILNGIDDPYTGNNGGRNIYNLGYAWSGRIKGLGTHGFNVAYRKRNPGSLTATSTFYPLKDQLTFSYGYSYPWSPKLRWVFETIGCYPIDKGDNKSATNISCLEVLGAARYRMNKTWAFVGGLTFEPGIQTMAPAYRAFAGMNFYMYPAAMDEQLKEEKITPTTVLPKPDEIITLQAVNFFFDTTTLIPDSEVILDDAIAKMQKMSIKKLIIAGHTDNIGTEVYNQDLSERRAETIANVIIEKLNLMPEQVNTVGYSYNKPVVPNKDDKSRLQNRRVELMIYLNQN